MGEDEQKAKEFIGAYNNLVKEWGYRIIVNPAFRLRDDGSYSIFLQYGVGKVKKEE